MSRAGLFRRIEKLERSMPEKQAVTESAAPKIIAILTAADSGPATTAPDRKFIGQFIGNMSVAKCSKGGMNAQYNKTRFRGCGRSPEGD